MKKMITSLIFVFLFIGCNNSQEKLFIEQDDESFLQIKSFSDISEGTVSVRLSGKNVTFEWNNPVDSCNNFSLVLYSSNYGCIAFCESYKKLSGSQTMTMHESIDTGNLGSLWVEFRSNTCSPSNVFVTLNYISTSGSYIGVVKKKCDHDFGYNGSNMNLVGDMNNSKVTGFLSIGKPYRAIMTYEYRDPYYNKIIKRYITQVFSIPNYPYSPGENMSWPGPYGFENGMISVTASIRLYLNDGSCKNVIPRNPDEFDHTSACTNYVLYTFSGYPTNRYLYFSGGSIVQ